MNHVIRLSITSVCFDSTLCMCVFVCVSVSPTLNEPEASTANINNYTVCGIMTTSHRLGLSQHHVLSLSQCVTYRAVFTEVLVTTVCCSAHTQHIQVTPLC